MKYFGIRIAGPYFLYDVEPITFGEIATDAPFAKGNPYYERGYFCFDDVKIVLEEYAEDQRTVVSTSELLVNGADVGDATVVQDGEKSVVEPCQYPMKWWYCDSGREFVLQYDEDGELDVSEIEIRVVTIDFSGRGKVKVVDGISYRGCDAEMDELCSGEVSCWCEYGGKLIKLSEGESVANQLVNIGFVAKRVSVYKRNRKYYIVGTDQSDRNAKILCEAGALPNDNGTYPCCVTGNSDDMTELHPNSYDESEIKEAMYAYDPVTGKVV